MKRTYDGICGGERLIDLTVPRVLICASMLLAALLGCKDKSIMEEQHRQRAMAEIQKLGGIIGRDEEISRSNGLSVRLESQPLSLLFVEHLKSLNAPLALELVDSHVTDAELSQLRVLASLQSLSLQLDPRATKEGLASLVSLTHLETLRISGGEDLGRENDYLGALAALENLRSLRVEVRWPQVLDFSTFCKVYPS